MPYLSTLSRHYESQEKVAKCLECQAGYPWWCTSNCEDEVEPTGGNQRGGQVKDNSDVTDITSTGRKRAADAYPIIPGMECQWAGLKCAGGGIVPIIGCLGNKAVARHHGPDKNTLHNDAGNVHLICVHCHNRWHTANDSYYAGERPSGDNTDSPWLPVGEVKQHDSITKATAEEVINNELYWSTRKTKKAEVD